MCEDVIVTQSLSRRTTRHDHLSRLTVVSVDRAVDPNWSPDRRDVMSRGVMTSSSRPLPPRLSGGGGAAGVVDHPASSCPAVFVYGADSHCLSVSECRVRSVRLYVSVRVCVSRRRAERKEVPTGY